ncbi:alpha/beta fold hydrolase [Paraburkholderia atlantica]|uniref:alpha/beta fold hydrolase n=1 Tax=Paraburkholderia atlantica TaxID=2654982 RepID=UPI00187B7C2B|nr:hypothetical protein [Paraburkholderia atlantica]
MRKSRSSAAAEPSWETVSAALKALLLDPEALSDELVGVRLEIYRDPRMKPNMFLSNAHAIARTAPNARLVEIKGYDHWAQYEQPERFNQESIACLQEA